MSVTENWTPESVRQDAPPSGEDPPTDPKAPPYRHREFPSGVSPLDTASELSVRVVKNLLVEYQHRYGRAQLESLFLKHQINPPLSYLESPENYVSTAVVERLQDFFIIQSGDKDFVKTAALQTATRESLGFAYYLLKALSNPKAGFETIVKLGSTFNRVGSFAIKESSRNSATLVYRSTVKEQNRGLCEARMAQLAAVPTIWGIPPATVKETACQVLGASGCEYHFRWQSTTSSWRRYVGALIATLAGGLAVVSHWVVLPDVGLLALAGFAAGGWLDTRAHVHEQDQQLYSQNTGMEESLHDLKRRHDELNAINEELAEINTKLEARVSERTSALRDSNQKLEEALQRQREVDRQKTEFFDNVSHELRTPLTIILLSLEALMQRANAVTPGAREHLIAMERSAARLLRLINNLLDLAKIEAGKRRLAYQPVEMNAFLKGLILPFKIAASERRIALDLEGDTVAPIQVDAELVDVVFQNLISNAIKFTTTGGVTVRLQETPTEVIVEVSDTGLGIPGSDLNLIFDRFAQADSSGVRRFGGTGIGLALVKETVELHGGVISVTSEVGKGSTFKVQLPKGEKHIREDLRERRLTEVPVRRDRRSSSELMARRPGGIIAGMGGQTDEQEPLPVLPNDAKLVLVVDDDKEIRRYVVAILREQFKVIEATDGREGIDMARAEKPDLIVSDVMMPTISGIQLTQALRQAAETADIPIILLTARQEIEARLSGFESGANDYVSKPFAPRELLARVDAHLRIREAATRAAHGQKLAVLGLLSSGFAHEVRNPLNGILNALEPLREMLRERGGDMQSAASFLNIIEQCGNRVHSLAEALLRFARPSNQEELVDLTECLDSTLQVLSWKLSEHILVKRDYQTADRIRGDPSALNLVFANLIDNAVKAVGDRGTLTLSTRKVENAIEVSVTDTGSGIPKSMRAQLFEPFVSSRSAGEGTGLGLALCRRVVLQHRGRITFTSDEGGTVFRVLLPSLDAAATVDLREVPS